MTPQSEKLLSLAELCEKAKGLDRELDALIRCAVFAPEGAYVRQSQINGAWCIYEVTIAGKERNWDREGRGEYTASLDAAMTLVPEGFRLFSLGEARYMTRSPAFCAQLEIWTSEGGIDGSANRSIGVANTLPLALCAAALRVRANDGGE